MFATLVKRHPEYEITVLLRTPPSNFSAKFPGVKVVVGDYDSADLISKTAAEADIVIRRKWPRHEFTTTLLTVVRR